MVGRHPGTPPAWRARSVSSGRYRLVEWLGAGGMAVVWSAFDEVLERPVAVKLPAMPADDALRRRIQREARSAARLVHPHIAGVFDYGETERRRTDSRPVRRDGAGLAACRCRSAWPTRRATSVGRGGDHLRADRLGAGRGPRARRGAPRCQAGQRDADPGRGQAGRLRHRRRRSARPRTSRTCSARRPTSRRSGSPGRSSAPRPTCTGWAWCSTARSPAGCPGTPRRSPRSCPRT